ARRRWYRRRDAIVEDMPQLEDVSERGEHAVAPRVLARERPRFFERLDLRVGIRILGQPPHHLEPGETDRRDCEPAAFQLGGLHDARDGTDGEPGVTATDFVAALDEHDAELAVAVD